jgi:hypothetical protein
MSRVSRKSELSPSVTRGGSGAIDLGKNSGVDMGQKSEPSLTSGGIGITQEVTNVGGMSVSVGGNIDITPVDFGININPSEGTISVATGAEIPGGLLGISGGIEVDLNTGEVIGGSIGGEVGGLGINLSNSKKGGLGIEFTLQIPGTPIELSLGFGFPPKEPTPTPTPSPTPSPSPSPTPSATDPPGPFPPGPLPPFGGTTKCTVVVAREYKQWQFYQGQAILANHWTSEGSFREDKGDVYYSSTYQYKYVYPPGSFLPSGSIPEFYPPWKQYTKTDSFAYGYLYGSSGQEKDVYAEINNQCGYYYYAEGSQIVATTYKIVYSNCPLTNNFSPPSPSPSPSPSPPSPFPNPPPRRQKKMDDCCRQNLAFLRLIYTKLGLAQFPGQLPNTIIQEIPKEGEEPAEPSQVPIPDLVSFLNWTFERDDERWGQWVVQINVKDSDITKEGDQGKQVKFPNLAESIAEIEGQILSLTANVDALVAITTKNLVESGLGRQEAIKSYLAAKAIIKYMAFKTTEIDVDIPACFTPEAQTIHELVNESTIHFKGIDYTEKETLRDIYLDLLQAAAIIRAVHWQRIDTKQDTKGQILNQLRGIAGLANSIKNPTPSGETQSKHTEDFEDFIDTVENGFRNVTGVADPENPYGKTPDRRPRIRQIGENISQAGGKS